MFSAKKKREWNASMCRIQNYFDLLKDKVSLCMS